MAETASREVGYSRQRASASSGQHVPLLLLDRHQAAAVLGVSSRTFEELMNEEWMPKPVQLGSRLLRWPIAELEEAISRMPRQNRRQEPVRERIARLKGDVA